MWTSEGTVTLEIVSELNLPAIYNYTVFGWCCAAIVSELNLPAIYNNRTVFPICKRDCI